MKTVSYSELLGGLEVYGRAPTLYDLVVAKARVLYHPGKKPSPEELEEVEKELADAQAHLEEVKSWPTDREAAQKACDDAYNAATTTHAQTSAHRQPGVATCSRLVRRLDAAAGKVSDDIPPELFESVNTDLERIRERKTPAAPKKPSLDEFIMRALENATYMIGTIEFRLHRMRARHELWEVANERYLRIMAALEADRSTIARAR